MCRRINPRSLIKWISALVYACFLYASFNKGSVYRGRAARLRELIASVDLESSERLGFCPKATDSNNASLSPHFRGHRAIRRRMWSRHFSDDAVVDRASRCRADPEVLTRYMETRPAVSLAFAITVHERLGNLDVLLQLISRPGHVICVHIDPKAQKCFYDDVHVVVACYKRRFPLTTFLIVPDPVKVYWGHVSLLKSDLKCLRLLLEHPWDYFVNLASSALPAHNMDLVEKMIASLDGKSLITGVPMPKKFTERIEFVHRLFNSNSGYQNLHRTTIRNLPPPYNLTIYKGYREVLLNRTFAEFCVRHPVARTLLRWFELAGVPDESFFNTLHWVHVDDVTGRVRQSGGKFERPFVIRFTLWDFEREVVACKGKYVRNICQFSMDDLPMLARQARDSIFVNKFNLDLDPLAVACWAERLLRSAKEEWGMEGAEPGKELKMSWLY